MLPPDSPVPGQLAGLCARLGINGHGITAPPVGDLQERWKGMLTSPSLEPQPPPAPGILAAAVAELPELDGAKIAIAGLHHGERGTIMHLLATGVTLEGDWPYARGIRPLPVLWIRDSDGRWHATRLDGVSPWGTAARPVDGYLHGHGVAEDRPPVGSRHRLDRDIRSRAIGRGPGQAAAKLELKSATRPPRSPAFLGSRLAPRADNAGAVGGRRNAAL